MKIKLNKDLPPIVFRIMSQFNHFYKMMTHIQIHGQKIWDSSVGKQSALIVCFISVIKSIFVGGGLKIVYYPVENEIILVYLSMRFKWVFFLL